MVEKTIENMSKLVNKLKLFIENDLEDVKLVKHEELLRRNDEKEELIEKISDLKLQLNNELVGELEKGVDVNIYRSQVDKLEEELKNLYELNKKLASIVLPIQQMYKELVEEISVINGGNAFDIKA